MVKNWSKSVAFLSMNTKTTVGSECSSHFGFGAYASAYEAVADFCFDCGLGLLEQHLGARH